MTKEPVRIASLGDRVRFRKGLAHYVGTVVGADAGMGHVKVEGYGTLFVVPIDDLNVTT